MFDLRLLFKWWSKNPTADQILRAVHQIETQEPEAAQVKDESIPEPRPFHPGFFKVMEARKRAHQRPGAASD